MPASPPKTLELDRAIAALFGLALADAMGMPAQTLDRPAIHERYGGVQGLIDPFDGHPVSHGLVAGQVTDDIEQTILLARRLTKTPARFDETAWANDLLAWEQDVRRRGLLDLLGPSSKRALVALLDGAPASEAGKKGTTNGGAMRIAPVGIATPAWRVRAFVDQVETVCRVTHHTGEAIAAAAAVSAVVSLGVAGMAFEDALPKALTAARSGQSRGHRLGVSDLADRIERALFLAKQGDPEIIADCVGNSVASHESVPAAFAITRIAKGDPWRAALIAANIGGDTDTIGAIAASMAAACRGMGSLPPLALDRLRSVNKLPMEALASDLLALRQARTNAAILEGAQA